MPSPFGNIALQAGSAGLGLLGPLLGGAVGGPFGGLISGAVGGIGGGILQGLGDAFGITDGATGAGGAADPANLQDLNKLMEASFYTPSGYHGKGAALEAQTAKSQLLNVPSAESVSQQGRLNSLAGQAVSSGQRSTDAARQATMQNMGQVRQAALDSVRAAGGPIAGLSAATKAAGQATSTAMGNLASQGAQNYQSSLQTAGGLLGQAENARMQDLMTRAQIFDRRAMTPAPQAAGLLDSIVGQRNQQYEQTNKLQEDVLAPLKAFGGLGQGNAFVDYLRQSGQFPDSNSSGALSGGIGPNLSPMNVGGYPDFSQQGNMDYFGANLFAPNRRRGF